MTKAILNVVATAALLAACGTQTTFTPGVGPVAAPQVAYRIDDHRYFEVVPLENLSCARARLFYTDTSHGIHTNVADWDRIAKGGFVIDAANDLYLVTPIIDSSSGCQIGAGDLCASRLMYSRDRGTTWQVNKPPYTVARDDVYLIDGVVYYAGRQAPISALEKKGDGAWTRFYVDGRNTMPSVEKQPIDDRLHCQSDRKD